jgi:Family of unknown function (DUF5683)
MGQLKFIFILFTLSVSSIWAQDEDKNLTVADSSTFATANEVIIRSIIVPGLGQIAQENLWKATLFYGGAATFYYKSFSSYLSYKKNNIEADLKSAKTNLSIAGFIHILNILDAYSSSVGKKPQGWNGALFSDKPVKSPWGATLRSAIFPGWGQFYNEAYVKSAVYFGLVSYVSYEIYLNKTKFAETGEKTYEDSRSRYSWYLGLTYLLMLTDAHVDAHLFEFDKAVKLAVSPGVQKKAIMVSLNLSF